FRKRKSTKGTDPASMWARRLTPGPRL
ncbi:unnamed protein product, partial [Caretta caretta]